MRTLYRTFVRNRFFGGWLAGLVLALVLLLLSLGGCASPSVVHRLETENAGLRDDVATEKRKADFFLRMYVEEKRAAEVAENQLEKATEPRRAGI